MPQFDIYPNPDQKKLAIDNTRLRNRIGTLSVTDRGKIRPALDKVIGEY